jgi:hypothetical protein
LLEAVQAALVPLAPVARVDIETLLAVKQQAAVEVMKLLYHLQRVQITQ